jgi:hypothetical protein
MPMSPGTDDRAALDCEIDRLVDEYRDRCLWFLREDFYPRNDPERLRTLDSIAQRSDRVGFQRARELTVWLLRLTSEKSVSS